MTASSIRAEDCPDDLELAAYVDGRLSVSDTRILESHIAECGRCAALVVETRTTINALGEPAATPLVSREVVGLLAAAALLVLAVISYRTFFGGGFVQTPQQAFARFLDEYGGARVIEPRVTGQLAHTPFTQTRGSSGTAEAATNPNVRRAGLAVENAARGRSDTRSLSVLGRTQLLLGQLDEAIATLTKADLARPEGLNDLSAAYIARGIQRANKEDLRRGLELVDRAIGSGARGNDVRFNRALALERLERTSEAIAAWREFVTVESDPGWRREGEEHLKRLAAARVSRNLGFARWRNESGLQC